MKVFTIFCGRQRYLSILMRYVTKMLEGNIIDECHLWDYTRSLQDHKFLAKFNQKIEDTEIKVMHVRNKENFGEYYQFYSKSYTGTDAVVIKSDDDIVYIDVEAMPAFIAFRISHPEHLLCFPVINNNGLCCHYMQQQNYGASHMIPPSCPYTFELNVGGFESLVSDGKKAVWLHNWFLQDRDTSILPSSHAVVDHHILIPQGQRVSINMFAVLSKDLHLLARPGVTIDDEKYLTMDMPSDVNRSNSIFTGMTVSHFGFGPQRGTGLEGAVETQLLARYEELAKRCVA